MLTSSDIRSAYGPRLHPVDGTERLHAGVDLALRQGSRIGPIAWGMVAKVVPPDPRDASRTSIIEILHPHGWKSRYVHLSAVEVRPGQWVAPGEIIGRSGGQPGAPGSGTSTTGPHLHLELLYRDATGWHTTDPVPWIFGGREP